MTKQEEIREGIDATICMSCEEVVDKRKCSKAICAYASGLRDALTKKLHSQGVVIHTNNQEIIPGVFVPAVEPLTAKK